MRGAEVNAVVRDGYGSEEKAACVGGRCLWGAACPFCFTAQLKCWGDDSERVEQHHTCQQSRCSGRNVVGISSAVTGDGEICHRRLSVNIHDVIFSLKGRSGDRLCWFDARSQESVFFCFPLHFSRMRNGEAVVFRGSD